MEPAVMAALISGASTLASAGGQTAFTAARNKKQRKWSEKMYQRQYDDNLALWNLQNEYNSPQAQMNRYKQAGLSPHLVYGSGNAGTASNIDAPQAPNVDLETPDLSEIGRGGHNAVESYFNTQTQQEQLKQIKTNIDATEASSFKTLTDAAQALFDLKLDMDTRSEKLKGRQGEALSKYSKGIMDEIDAYLATTLKSQREEAMSSNYLETVNSNLLKNWDAVAQLDVRKSADGERLLNEFIKAGLSRPVAMAINAELQNTMLSNEIRFYTPNLIIGAISKVLGGLPGIGGFIKSLRGSSQKYPVWDGNKIIGYKK